MTVRPIQYIDKSKLKVGDRISFMYWGKFIHCRNKRHTGRVMVSPETKVLFVVFVVMEAYLKAEFKEIDKIILLK